MEQVFTKSIRNVALLGHSGGGKTSLAESMLYISRLTDRLGNIADGNTICDYDPEEVARKNSIRKIGLAIGLPSLALFAISFGWSFLYLFITMKCLKMTYNESIAIINNPAIQQILQITLSTLMFLVPFTIGAKCLKFKIGELIMFNKVKKGTFLPFLLIGMGFCSFANISVSYASSIFEGFGIEYDVDFGRNPEGVFGFLLSFIATAIVPAIVEEFACRGIMIGILKKYGEGFAVISSAVIFGIMHGNFEQIPFATMVGLILGYIYVKTGSIWTCMAVHCVNNSIAVIFSYLPNTALSNIIYILCNIFSKKSTPNRKN